MSRTKTQKCPVPWREGGVAPDTCSTPRYSSSSTCVSLPGDAEERDVEARRLRDADDLLITCSSSTPRQTSSSPSRPQ